VLYLSQIEAEKKHSDELLHVILPPDIVKELKSNGFVAPRRHEDVAVLFCDIVGFTPYSASRQPEEIVAALQQLFEAYEDLSASYDMYKIKTIGDSFMSTAGLLVPVANPCSPPSAAAWRWCRRPRPFPRDGTCAWGSTRAGGGGRGRDASSTSTTSGATP
jgi:class 3 adenylate cyclase